MKAFSRSGATAQRKTKAFRCAIAPPREIFLILFLSSLTVVGCRQDAERGRVPSEVNEVITTVGENLAQERYEQIYNESSDLWKRDVTLEQSNEVFKTLRAKQIGRASCRERV